MNRSPLSGLGDAITGLRVIRNTNGVVALAILLLAVILIASWIAPLEDTLRYVVLALCFGSAFLVWFFYWRKAKGEPLAATEEYLIAALPFWFGQDDHLTTRAAELQAPKVEPDLLPEAKPSEQIE